MNAKDQRKLCEKGYVILRKQDNPYPHIKYKSINNPSNWKKLESYFNKTIRDKEMNKLLQNEYYIED